jgi:hypothetical protein
LKHKWFEDADSEDFMKKPLEPKILQNLMSYKGISTLRKEAMSILVKMLDANHTNEIR